MSFVGVQCDGGMNQLGLMECRRDWMAVGAAGQGDESSVVLLRRRVAGLRSAVGQVLGPHAGRVLRREDTYL